MEHQASEAQGSAVIAPDTNSGQSLDGPASKVATVDSRVILGSAKGADGSARDDKPLSNSESAKTSDSHPSSDRNNSEEKVATPFYSLNPAEISRSHSLDCRISRKNSNPHGFSPNCQALKLLLITRSLH